VLRLTANARTAIRGLLHQRRSLGDTAGLRITKPGDEGTKLSLDAAPGPEPGDQVIEHKGARVFVGARAAEVLDEMALDARVDSGRVRYFLTPQG
jgi:iron-sulfur cluster assembly protein